MQSVEDGSLQQKCAGRCGLALQNLVDEIVRDVAVVASERSNESGGVVIALKG